MFTFEYTLADDRSTITLKLPSATVSMTASELENFIRALAVVRANVQPAVPDENPGPATPVSAVPSIRWYVCPDQMPTQIQLSLLHLGFGWVSIPLSRDAAREMTETMERCFQSLQTLQ